MSKPTPATVRVYPLPVAPIDGVPHKVMDVDAATATRLTRSTSRHSPLGVFVTDPALLPPGYLPPDPDGLIQPSGTTPATSED